MAHMTAPITDLQAEVDALDAQMFAAAKRRARNRVADVIAAHERTEAIIDMATGGPEARRLRAALMTPATQQEAQS